VSRALRFTKMSGAGNDFIVLDEEAWGALPGERGVWVRTVCRRGMSVGADGVLVVAPAGPGRVSMLYLNADGSEAFCGNGSRCAARYAVRRGMAAASMTLVTAAGEVPATVTGARVSVILPPPEDRGPIELASAGRSFSGRWIRAGVPHVVFPAASLATFPLERHAPGLRAEARLGAEGANVDLVERDARGRIHVRTWERGVEGETLSCGTGAVAAAFAARLAGSEPVVTIVPRSGSELTVELPGEPSRPPSATLTGDARFVFDGSLDPEGSAGPA